MKFDYIFTLTLALALVPLVSASGIINLDYNVKYYLYTRLSSAPQELSCDVASFQNSNFSPLKRTKIIVHGFHEDVMDPLSSSQRILQGYICNGADLNYLLISYNTTITGTYADYVLVNFDQIVKDVGQAINIFLTCLKNNFSLNNSKFDLVAHSLGAQIAAYLGELQPSYDKFLRFFAIDPAGPFYTGTPPKWRVSPDDAIYVEQTISSCTFGTCQPVGKAVIYINSIVNQPYCQGPNDVSCNHRRSVDLFAEAVCHPTVFTCTPCGIVEILLGSCPTTPKIPYGDEPYVVKSGIFIMITDYKPDYIPTTNLLPT